MRLRALFLTLAALLLIAAPAQADSVVDTHADVVAVDGKCSLREAVGGGAADCGTGTIRLPGGGGPYLLSSTLPFTNGTVPTRVESDGAVIQANGAFRVVVVSAARTAFLSGLTIKGGVATGPTFAGGGITNLGNLTLERVVVTGNTVAPAPAGANGGTTGGTGSVGGNGGGIYNAAGSALTLDRTTVSGNTAGTGGAGGFGDPSSPTSPAGGRGGGGGKGGSGGGIFNVGTATLTDSTVTGNSAGAGGAGAPGLAGWDTGGQGGAGGFGGQGGDGGGIANVGTLTIARSTIAGNRAGRGGAGSEGGDGGAGTNLNKNGGNAGYGGSAGNGGQGGGVYTSIVTTSVTTVTNSTIAGNAGGDGGAGKAGGNGGASGGAGGTVGLAGYGGEGGDGGYGGGLFAGNAAAVTLALTHATIAANRTGTPGAGGSMGSGTPGPSGVHPSDPGSPGFGSGAYVNMATVTARNSIFGGNTCVGEIDELGGSTSSPGNACGGLQRDPRLGPLASNGGPTQTMALRAGSPAIDLIRANGDGCATTDQRGVQRPIGGRCDAGAYEAPLSVRPGGSKPSLSSPRAKLKGRRLRLTYRVSGPGKLAVRLFMKSHKRVGGATARPKKAGKVTVRIKLARRALRALKARGKLRITARAVFTATGDLPIRKSKRLMLRKR